MKKTSRGDIVLISGNDAQTIKEIEKSKENNPQKTQSTIETLIYTKLENGIGKKPESQIILGSSQLSTKDLTTAQLTGKSPIKAKINKFKYSCYQTFYTAKIDGAIRKDILPTDKETCQTKCANAVAEYKELNL